MSSKTTESILKKIEQYKLEKKLKARENGKERGVDLKIKYKKGQSPSYNLKTIKEGKWTPVNYSVSPRKSLSQTINSLENEFNKLENQEFGKLDGPKFKKSERRFIPTSPKQCPQGSYFRQANIAQGAVKEQRRGATCAVLPEGNDWVEAISKLAKKLEKLKNMPPIPANILAKELRAPWEASTDLGGIERINQVVKEAYKNIVQAQKEGTLNTINNWVEGIKVLEQKLRQEGVPVNASIVAEYLAKDWKHEKSLEENNKAINNAFNEIMLNVNPNYEAPVRKSFTHRNKEQKRELRRNEQRRHKKLLEKIEESSSSESE